MIYRDGLRGSVMVKRFAVAGTTRDKEYVLTKGSENSKVHYFSLSPDEKHAETVKVIHKDVPKLRKREFEIDLTSIAVKGRDAKGSILIKHPVNRIGKLNESKPAE